MPKLAMRSRIQGRHDKIYKYFIKNLQYLQIFYKKFTIPAKFATIFLAFGLKMITYSLYYVKILAQLTTTNYTLGRLVRGIGKFLEKAKLITLGSKNARIELGWEYRRLLSQPAGGKGRFAPLMRGLEVQGKFASIKCEITLD